MPTKKYSGKQQCKAMRSAAAEQMVGDRAGTADCGKSRGKPVIKSTSYSLCKHMLRWRQIILVYKHYDR